MSNRNVSERVEEQVGGSIKKCVESKLENKNIHVKKIKQFFKLKNKYYKFVKKKYRLKIWSCYKVKGRTERWEKKQNKPKEFKYYTDIGLFLKKLIDDIFELVREMYIEISSYLKEVLPNINIKYIIYVFFMCIFVNIILFICSLFVYFFLYFYIIPQNKYVYKINFSLARDPIDTYLSIEDFCDKKNKINENTFCLNSQEKKCLKDLNFFFKNENVDKINSNKDMCCFSKNSNNRIDNDFSFFFNKNFFEKNNEDILSYFYERNAEYKYLESNILKGEVNFNNIIRTDNEIQNNWKIYNYFISFFTKKKNTNKLKIKKGYKIDILLNFSYINNSHNDKLNFLQIDTHVYNYHNSLILKSKKMHMKNKNYDFINNLHLIFNAPFYFFNLFIHNKIKLYLINEHIYTDSFKKIRIYIFPAIQMIDANIVVLVYSNFYYYYIYKHPILFSYIVFLLSFVLIFFNSILFLFGGMYYYLYNN
ncbi:conserved Plasmodium protein, unknown function [Plasmodium vinckei vinckei]|uniref:Seipin domain-containing protein n=1 Tax=Plasmodium vinckei vinckei TaxID=54757 RepID=A0A081IAD5_PLAVN|nr:conserved Plasmodium protein, unknown function [Plasmodium vinckei vinckei]KEG00643.1 hypothetical protein YYE_04474 [Plasmodium vinckei vinckei]VEV54663.1 conserved Plasmodium protein, unknown function [Plasmodium vinckei vinckei]